MDDATKRRQTAHPFHQSPDIRFYADVRPSDLDARAKLAQPLYRLQRRAARAPPSREHERTHALALDEQSSGLEADHPEPASDQVSAIRTEDGRAGVGRPGRSSDEARAEPPAVSVSDLVLRVGLADVERKRLDIAGRDRATGGKIDEPAPQIPALHCKRAAKSPQECLHRLAGR